MEKEQTSAKVSPETYRLKLPVWETERTDAGAEVPAAGACSKDRKDKR